MVAHRWRSKRKYGDFSGPTDLARIWEMEPPAPGENGELGQLDEVIDRVHELMEAEDLDDAAAETLSLGYPLISGREIEEMPEPTFLAGRSVAAIGYMARQAEYERFPRARTRIDKSSPLRAALESVSEPRVGTEPSLAAAVAALVRREAIDPATADGFGPSASVPGISAAERTELRERTLTIGARPRPDGSLDTREGVVRDATLDDMRRTWKYGFLLRCLVQLTLEE
jgi:hypothetical protein